VHSGHSAHSVAGGLARHWHELTGETPRIAGIDLARGLAVVGMFAAHTLILDDFDWVDAATWAAVVDGRSSVLFATLAGVSVAILSGGRSPFTGVDLSRARTRILVRAVLLFALGGLLTALGTIVYVILQQYAVLFVIALVALRWSARRLLVTAAVGALVLPVLGLALKNAWFAAGFTVTDVIDIVLTGAYPVIVWVVYLFAGLGVGRLDLASTSVRIRLLWAGTLVSAAGYGAGAAVIAIGGAGPENRPGVPAGASALDLSALRSIAPHSGTPFEVLGAGGFAISVLAGCLLLARPLRYLVFPIVAVGRMPLSAYSAQLLVIALVWEGGAEYWILGRDNAPYFWSLTLGALVLCTLWALVLGRGPLERLLTTVSRRAVEPPTHPTDAELSASDAPIDWDAETTRKEN
jgi:uncharacterized membrane protein YeiB